MPLLVHQTKQVTLHGHYSHTCTPHTHTKLDPTIYIHRELTRLKNTRNHVASRTHAARKYTKSSGFKGDEHVTLTIVGHPRATVQGNRKLFSCNKQAVHHWSFATVLHARLQQFYSFIIAKEVSYGSTSIIC